MTIVASRNWMAIALLAGVAYAVFGVGFGELSARAGSHHMVVAWRLAAWVVSALVFGAHLLHEIRITRSVLQTALRAAVGAAIGSFGLAVGAVLHSLSVSPAPQTVTLIRLSLIVWPVMTLIAAYPVGIVAAAVLRRLVEVVQ